MTIIRHPSPSTPQLVEPRRLHLQRSTVAEARPDAVAMPYRLRHIRLAPALKIGCRMAIVSYLMWVTALAGFVLVCRSLGLVERFEETVRSLGVRGFHVTSEPLLVALLVFGGVWLVGVLVLTVVLVACFNLASFRSGGLELELIAPPEHPRAPAGDGHRSA